MKALLFLLVTATAALAQPWQWELVEPDWRNPSGLSQFSEYYTQVVGDLTGDGLAEITEIGTNLAVNVQGPAGHWNEVNVVGGPAVPASYHVTAQNLDEDPALELVLCDVEGATVPRCFEISTPEDPWEWIERPDLLEGMIPIDFEYFRAITWGNFDHDDAEECAVITTLDIYETDLNIFERADSQQPWTLSISYSVPFSVTSLYAGDIEHDGDTDIGLSVNGLDGYEGTMFFENTEGGLMWHNLLESLVGSGGGDLDGDGEWEFLFLNTCTVPPYSSTDGPFEMEVESLQQFNFARNLRRFENIVGNIRSADSTWVAAMNNFYCFSPWGGPNTTRTDVRDVHNDQAALFSYSSFAFFSPSMGDVNGDGLRDMLAMHESTSGISWEGYGWKILLNVGNETFDNFAVQSAPDFIVDGREFPDEFSNPRLGDVDGDGRAELILYPLNTVFPGTIEIFRMEQLTPTEVFTRAYDLEVGLPDSIQMFEVADLDGDGVSEILPFIFGERFAYFFRNGQWETYEGILPQIDGVIRGFADWDNDGTTDIFTDEGIYLNLSPTAADEEQILNPSSFVLSAYPNPFNAQTMITFDLPKAGDVSLRIFDLLGREVQTLLHERMSAGTHTINYNASELPSGMFFAALTAGHHRTTEKLLLLK